MAYKFGKKSQERLATCDKVLAQVLERAILRSPVDFGTTEGHRSFEKQLEHFKSGRSRIDPRDHEQAKAAKHLRSPSHAVDIYIHVPGEPGLAYDREHLACVAGVILATAADMGVEMRWGGNWDRDGEILTDQDFDDMPHFELVTVTFS